jgi:hypothetical protein
MINKNKKFNLFKAKIIINYKKKTNNKLKNQKKK